MVTPTLGTESVLTLGNIASWLPRRAAESPERPAVVVPRRRARGIAPGDVPGTSWTFAQLEGNSNQIAHGLSAAGIERGHRVIVMIRPGLEFTGVIFALFKMGAIPVMIDPGMGMARMVECIREVEPDAFIGIPLAQVMRILHRRRLGFIRVVVTVGRRAGWGGLTLEALTRGRSPAFDAANVAPTDAAAILFTTGSTGPPKGVLYEHGMFLAQTRWIQSHYSIEPGEVDLPTFPLFALFGTAMGMTCVVPDMDPTRPANVDPVRIVDAVSRFGVTNTFGSPALWRVVARYCVARNLRLPTLRRILIAGAPVSGQVIEDLHQVLSPEADVHTPYGATESLPVSSISGRDLITNGCIDRARGGAGTCVGLPLPGVDVRLIRITDEPICDWSDDLVVPDGEHGEIVVSSAVVTRSYYRKEAATRAAKIMEGDRLWHRMGDVGYRDGDGRLWFCGRKAHCVRTARGTRFSVECEAIFNEHPDVYRSALVGVGPAGAQVPVIVIEPNGGRVPRGARRRAFIGALLALAARDPRTLDIRHVLFRRALPVDIRHNAKIFREKIAIWAQGRLA